MHYLIIILINPSIYLNKLETLHILKLTISWVFVGNDLITATKEFSEWFLEVLIEGDVDDWVYHGVWVGQHVDPELIVSQPHRQLQVSCFIFFSFLDAITSVIASLQVWDIGHTSHKFSTSNQNQAFWTANSSSALPGT